MILKQIFIFKTGLLFSRRVKLLSVLLLAGLFSFGQQKINRQNNSLNLQLQKVDSLINIKAYNKATSLITKLKNTYNYTTDTIKFKIDFRTAKVLYRKDQADSSLNLLLHNFDKIKNSAKLTELYAQRMGRLFYAAKNYPKSIPYYKIALNYAQKIKDTIRIIRREIDIGTSYFRNKQLDSAKIYYIKATAYPLLKKFNSYIARAYGNLVAIAITQNQYDLASQYSLQSIKISEQEKDTVGMAYNLVNLGNIYYGVNNFTKAATAYLKAYNFVKKDSTKEIQKLKRDALYNLAYAEKGTGNYKKAINSLLLSYDLLKQINKEDLTENLSAVAAKYNVAQKEKDLQIQKIKNLNKTYFIYGISLFAVLIIFFGFLSYKNYRLKQDKKLDAILNTMQTKILNATIDAKENERKTIASILHDSVSALLSAANLHLQASKSQIKGKIPVEITKAQDIVSEASVKIRDLSHELISSVLLKFGLAFALHDLCQKYSNKQIYFHSKDVNIERYDQDFEIKMHSIIEELINNVIKHSKAKNASIMLRQRSDNKLLIQIIDDGIGFNVAKAKQKEGLGLSHIGARITILGGKFIIHSQKGQGTDITITVPIKFLSES